MPLQLKQLVKFKSRTGYPPGRTKKNKQKKNSQQLRQTSQKGVNATHSEIPYLLKFENCLLSSYNRYATHSPTACRSCLLQHQKSSNIFPTKLPNKDLRWQCFKSFFFSYRNHLGKRKQTNQLISEDHKFSPSTTFP